MIFAWLFGVSVSATSARIDAVDLLVLGALYALLACALGLLSAVVSGAGWPARLLGSVAIASVLVWHAHEELLVPSGITALLATTAVVAGIHSALRGASNERSTSAGWPALVATALVFALLLAIAYFASPTLRWHLLRHNKLLGTPAYYLLDRSLAARERSLRESHPPPPARAQDRPRGEAHAAVDAPHIVFVVVDTLRADALARLGATRRMMPAVDRLASRSYLFRNLQANSSWTKPSVASFFTGLLPEEHGALDFGDLLADAHVTLAERLTAMGYRCAAFVTNEHLSRETGFDQGFAHFASIRDDSLPYARAETVNLAVESYLEESPIAAPQFLYLHYFDPHMPYLSGGRNSVFPAIARSAYQRELEYIDGELDEIVRYLDRRLGRRMVLLLTSDHGEEFGEHDGDYLRHGHSLYRELVHIPAILYLRGVLSAEITARLEGRDLFDLVIGLASEPGLDIESWADRRDRSTRYSLAYLSMSLPLDRPYLSLIVGRALAHDDWVLIWSAYGDTFELYDMARDPWQRHNALRNHPAVVEDLRRRMADAVSYWYGRQQAEISEETRRDLRALGYLD